MENINPSQAARVWQRVRGNQTDDPEQLLAQLIAQEWEDASIYLQLSRRTGGKEAAALYQLFQQEQAHCSCLKGIYTLTTGKKPAIPAVKKIAEPMEIALRHCYGREMRCLSAYEQRREDPQYGHVFARLAQQEQEHCRVVLELIGSGAKG